MESGTRRYVLAMAIALGWVFLPGCALADDALAGLQAEAREMALAEAREWQDLLHYRPRRFLTGRRSDTRSRAFFNAEDGWRDPVAELDATLAAFLQPLDAVADGEQHPQCRFPARFQWLKDRLAIDPKRLPAPDCERLEEWRDAIDPHSVTLVFAAAYLGNPASMFGHTLLRLDPEDQHPDSRTLSYVINHAAATTETSGFVFAARGLTGGYPGRFSLMPYYEKVREYSGLENRDLWEYRLDLSPEEVDRLLMHTWELSEAAFPYYFLYQNCSYRLLGLLDVARPGMNLSDRFNWYAIPTDTVRVTLAEEGILAEVVYRPAERTILDHRLDGLTEEEQALVLAVADGELAPEDERLGRLDTSRQAKVLEVSQGLLQFRLGRGDADPDARHRMRELLVARSQLGPGEEGEAAPVPEVRPDQGHGTLRLGAGAGRRADANFLSLHWRPAYHDFLDPVEGYIPGAHIAYGDLEIRYDLARETPSLERLMLVDIESISPRTRVFSNRSWRIRGGVEQRPRPGGGRSLMAGVAGGGGHAWALPDSSLVGMLGVQLEGWASERLDDGGRAGIGPRLDLFRTGEQLRWTVSAAALGFSDASAPAWRLGFWQSASLGRQASLRAGLARERDFGETESTIQLQVHGYF